MPFLTIVTRTYRRPERLAACIDSVRSQSDQDIEHVVLLDDVGLGIQGSMTRMAEMHALYHGQYIYCLDDDNILQDREFVADLKRIVAEHSPDVIMVRADHPQFAMLPLRWQERPVRDGIDLANYVIRADLWRKYAHLLGSEEYAGDYAMIAAIYDAGCTVYWHDKVVAVIKVVSYGQAGIGLVELLRIMRENIPGLFPAGNVLYIGANRCASPTFAADLVRAGNTLDLLEIWETNLRFYEADGGQRFRHVIHGDVRNLTAKILPRAHYDAIFWWHGPEHIEHEQFEQTLARLNELADLVFIGCPWGQWDQGANDGNPSEVHLSAVYPDDFTAAGYEFLAIGSGADEHGLLMAWRSAKASSLPAQTIDRLPKEERLRLLIIYPGHSHNTYDVAYGYEWALRAAGHTVRAFNYHTQLAFYDRAIHWWTENNPHHQIENPTEAVLLLASEQSVLEAVEMVPHAVIVVNGFALHRRAYDLIHQLCLPVILLLTESPYLDPEQARIAIQGHASLVLTNDLSSVESLATTGVRIEYLPHSYSQRVHYPQQVNGKYTSDLFFFGTMWPERKRLLDPLNAWVRRWHKEWNFALGGTPMMTGRNAAGLVDNDELARYYCGTKIALNHHRSIRSVELGRETHIVGAHSLGPRAFEIAACGAFQLCDDSRPELAEVFGDSVATYHDAADLRRKAAYYLTHDDERQAMAEASYKRVQLCSFEQRAKGIVIPAIQEVIQHG